MHCYAPSIEAQAQPQPAERRTWYVIALTAGMTLIEIVTGLAYGSMALLADGLHMASHTAALGITALTYYYARRYAHDCGFSFGTGKFGALGGFTSALLLGVFALLMAWESVLRLFNPMPIAFAQALLVAVLGLIVNGVSAVMLADAGHAHDDHTHHADHHIHHSDSPDHPLRTLHTHPDPPISQASHTDHNLQAAYLHVLADALTSLLAIVALLVAWFGGWLWMDAVMGIVGSGIVSLWAWGLLQTTSGILLDRQAAAAIQDQVQHALETEDVVITDFHIWEIGTGRYAAAIALKTALTDSPDDYKKKLAQLQWPSGIRLDHVTIEIHYAECIR